MRILGIDPGSRVTGFGVIDTDGAHHSLVTQGVVRVRTTGAFAQRLNEVYRGLAAVIESERPDQMAVEDLFFHTNAKSALKLGHVRGVALLAGAERDIPIHEYAPLEVKQAVTGYGRADKGQVQKMVAVLLAMKSLPTPHDAADALAVALCHANRLRYASKVAAST